MGMINIGHIYWKIKYLLFLKYEEKKIPNTSFLNKKLSTFISLISILKADKKFIRIFIS